MLRTVVIASLLFAGSALAAYAEPRNVLLICVDDLKPTIGCFGDAFAVTPNIDRLARRGVRFDAAYCNQAVCSPSRNSLMTGLRPQTIGVYDLGTHFRLAAPDVVTFSQHFIKHGYHAAGLGKIYHVGHGNTDDKLSWSVPSWKPGGSAYASPESIASIRPDAKGKRRGPATEAADVPDETYADGKVADEAVARLRQAAETPQQPFFLAVGFVKPHLPFVAPQKYWDMYNAEAVPMPEVTERPVGAPSYAATSYGELRNYSDMPKKGDIDEATTRHLIHGYYAATSYADAQIGKLLDAVDELDLAENTIIVLWGDHGWHLGDHGMWCKHTNYEQAACIPVIISAPGGARDAAASAMIETVDLFPTVAQLAGIEGPKNIDGISQASVVGNPASHVRNHVTHVYPRSSRLGRAIRNERYRMVEWRKIGIVDKVADVELYDYKTDPLETKNVAENRPDVVDAMRAILTEQPEPKLQWKATLSASTKGTSETTHRTSKKRKKPFDRKAAFLKRDVDKDGFLTLVEFVADQKDAETFRNRFPGFDTNGDGKLSPAEYIRDKSR